MNKLEGVVIPMITPLTEEDEIDVLSLQNLTDHCIEGGMNCLYPCGTTGEMMYLSVEERKLAAETVVIGITAALDIYIEVSRGPVFLKELDIFGKEKSAGLSVRFGYCNIQLLRDVVVNIFKRFALTLRNTGDIKSVEIVTVHQTSAVPALNAVMHPQHR